MKFEPGFQEAIITSAKREVKDSRSSGMFQSCHFGTSECPEVASELVRDIFEFFDLLFQGKNNFEKVLLLEEIENK